MAKAKIKIGYAPTRRAIFSAPAAIQFRGLIADRLRELEIDFVDIDDINDEGLLFDDAGTDCFFPMQTSERSMSAEDWQKNLAFPFCCGDRGTSARTRRACA